MGIAFLVGLVVLQMLASADAYAADPDTANAATGEDGATPVITIKIDRGDKSTANGCTNREGALYTNKKGKICVLPATKKGQFFAALIALSKPAAIVEKWTKTHLGAASIFNIASNDEAGKKVCDDQKGAVYADAKGAKVCVLPRSADESQAAPQN